MHLSRHMIRVAVVVLGVVVMLSAVSVAAAARVWRIAPTPNLGTTDNCLNAVSGAAHGGVWALGSGGSGTFYCGNEALIEQHPPGAAWRLVPAGGLAGWEGVTLFDVAAVSSRDAWAVGIGGMPNFGPTRPVIEHWNGTAWTLLPTNVGFRLNAITRVPGTRHLWTVGINSDTNPQNWAGYWDGTRWRFQTVPTPKQRIGSSFLTAVSAASEADVWAIASQDINDVGDVGRAYADHWNGKRWTLTWLPGSKTGNEQLFDAANVPHSHTVWAVGRYQALPDRRVSALTERYHNGHWEAVPSADRGIRSELASVVAIRPGNLWAVGAWYDRNYHPHALIEHYTHGRWIIVPSPNTRRPDSSLHGLAAVPHNGRTLLWAVGQSGGDRPQRTLAIRGW